MNGIEETESEGLTYDEEDQLHDCVYDLQEWIQDQINKGRSQSYMLAAVVFYGKIIYDAQRGNLQ